ncbi:MAG: leader peptide processing enzyme [Sphaerochaetaceae bacterium]
MNKKLNTALFLIGATLLNVLIMIVLFLVCLFLLNAFVDPESSMASLWIGLMFLVSIGGSFFIYTLIMKVITKKFDLEHVLHPLFKSRSGRGSHKQGD